MRCKQCAREFEADTSGIFLLSAVTHFVFGCCLLGVAYLACLVVCFVCLYWAVMFPPSPCQWIGERASAIVEQTCLRRGSGVQWPDLHRCQRHLTSQASGAVQ